jgi:hypothetical protein
VTLEELADAARTDPEHMPALVALSRRLMADPDPQTRTDAAAMAFYAVRQMLPMLTIAERTTLCDATLVELDAAMARGLVGPKQMLAAVLRKVLVDVIAKPLETDELLRAAPPAH